jgi:hypothetical protein
MFHCLVLGEYFCCTEFVVEGAWNFSSLIRSSTIFSGI